MFSPIGELLRLVGAVEYVWLSMESIELIVEAFDGLLTWIACRRESNMFEVAVGEVGDVLATLCDGGAYAFSNLDVPTGLTERSGDILGSVLAARRISLIQANYAPRLSALACGLEGSTESQDPGTSQGWRGRVYVVNSQCEIKEEKTSNSLARSLLTSGWWRIRLHARR